MLRLLALGIEVLILDEPTTGISDLQKEALFDALRKLASEGKSVILVSHKLKDSEALCDRVTVLREGVVTGSMESPYDANELLSMMFGEPPLPSTRSPVEYGQTVLSMNDISGMGGRTGLSHCTVSTKEGEMIGLAGLEGSGQGVFLRIAAGITKPTSGSLQLFGEDMDGNNLHAFKEAGVVFLPASRLEEGLMPDLSIQEHFALKDRESRFFVKWDEAFEEARLKTEKFRVKGTPDTIAEALSGGNQQRLMLSLLSKESTLLLLEQPTRGLDVESANWVWWHLSKYCLRKTSIIFSSADLDEIMSIADRILVFFDGMIIKDVRREEANIKELAEAIAGKR
jgi:simple sugar transport system ATP-binding protein